MTIRGSKGGRNEKVYCRNGGSRYHGPTHEQCLRSSTGKVYSGEMRQQARCGENRYVDMGLYVPVCSGTNNYGSIRPARCRLPAARTAVSEKVEKNFDMSVQGC